MPFCVASFGMAGTTWSSDGETYFSNVNVYLQAGGDEAIRVPYTIEVGSPVYDFIPDDAYYNWEVSPCTAPPRAPATLQSLIPDHS